MSTDKLSRENIVEYLAGIELLSLDTDGVLTDGGIYFNDAGEEIRKFNVKDGMGIKLAQAKGVKVVIITSSSTPSIGHRAAALGVDPSEFVAVSDCEEIRQALIDSTNLARERGVFGAPSIIIEDELYWGKDRMDFVEDHLSRLD